MHERPTADADPPVCAVGLDGCRAGWIAAIALGDCDAVAATQLQLFADINKLIAWRESKEIEANVCIDVPIGLPDTAGLRQCDREAREQLGRRWMCVFEPPDRELFNLDFYTARKIVLQRRATRPEETHHILSHQAIQITPKIAEVDRALHEDRSRADWLIEVHPEISFHELARSDLPAKKTKAGKQRRHELLRGIFTDINQIETPRWLRREVGHDDILDAYAALWTALRYSRKPRESRELGAGQHDKDGLPMRMVV